MVHKPAVEIVTVTMYKTSDGSTYQTPEAAQEHARHLALLDIVDDLYWRDISPGEVIDRLIERADDVVAILSGAAPSGGSTVCAGCGDAGCDQCSDLTV